mgnify:CR=1 FL=1
MKKIYIMSILLIVLIVSFLGITYSFSYEQDYSLDFSLIGPSPLYVDVNSKYEEYGIVLKENGNDISKTKVLG